MTWAREYVCFNSQLVMQVLDDSKAMLDTLWKCHRSNSPLFDVVELALHAGKAMGTNKLIRREKGLFSSAAWCSIFRMIAIVASVRYPLQKTQACNRLVAELISDAQRVKRHCIVCVESANVLHVSMRSSNNHMSGYLHVWVNLSCSSWVAPELTVTRESDFVWLPCMVTSCVAQESSCAYCTQVWTAQQP